MNRSPLAAWPYPGTPRPSIPNSSIRPSAREEGMSPETHLANHARAVESWPVLVVQRRCVQRDHHGEMVVAEGDDRLVRWGERW